MSGIPDRIANLLTTYSKPAILLMLLLTVAIGAGLPMVEQDSDTGQFESESEAADAQDYIEQNFVVEDRENQTVVQVIRRGDNVLSQDSLAESLRFQQELRQTESINRTLDPERGIYGIANVIAVGAIELQAAQQQPPAEQTADGQQGNESAGQQRGQDGEGGQAAQQQLPPLEQQIAALESLSDEQFEQLLQRTLGGDIRPAVRVLLPASFDSSNPTQAKAHNTFVRQRTQASDVQDPNSLSPAVLDAQLEIRDLANQQDAQYTVFGFGIISEEIDQSLGDSGAIVGPLALLFVVLALTVAYRDLLDIVLGVIGIITVLIWTFGFMGWANIAFNQLLLSVPVLLIGLSIDYAIHVFMRHREQRTEGGEERDLQRSMQIALAGVGAALVWVTATAAIGFLANLTSPIGPLRDFGVVSAFGVVAALLIFGVLIPALKIEIDGFLEQRLGLDRQKRAFGTGGSLFSRLLGSGSKAARKFPVVVLALALILSAGGAYGATQVDTSFNQEDFLADSPPEWTYDLPEPFKPGTYQAKNDLDYIQENFQQEGNEGELLLRGDVTNDEALQWMAAIQQDLGERESTFKFEETGQADVRTPLTVMQRTAAEQPNSSFAQRYQQAVAESDGEIPQGNIQQLYDELLEVNPQASEFIYRNDDGEYEALRIIVGINGQAGNADVADDLCASADSAEDTSGGRLEAIATGDQVVFDNVEQDLLATVIQGLIITLVAVFIFLSVAYRLTGSPASLGIVTLLPVLFSVTWILGSMWLLDIPFNTLTGTITSLTVGLGIAYSIHISSRYELELRRKGDVWEAMETTVTGTGGALLGSAATTVGGFGTLVFAILPVLRQFGIITGLTIIYAFLASVLVLPSMLVLWTRYFGPSGYFPGEDAEGDETPDTAETPAPDGGSEAE